MNFKALFPRASHDFIAANTKTNGTLSATEPQHDAKNTLGKARKRKAKVRRRTLVSYRTFVVRPRDADNMVAALKQGQDCLVAVGLLPNDDPYSIKVEWEQEKVVHYADEKIEIEITDP